MMRRVAAIMLMVAALATGGCAKNSPGAAQQNLGMTVISSITITDNRMVVQMNREFNSTYTVEKMADPFRTALILPDIAIGDMPEVIPSDKAGISEIRITMVQTPVLLTRVEITLREPMDVSAGKNGASIKLDLRTAGEAVEIQKSKPLPMVTTVSEEGEEIIELLPATEITAIDMAASDKETRLVVYGDGSMEPDIFTLPGRIVIDVPHVALQAPVPSTVYRPVSDLRVGSYDDKVRIVLDLDHEGDFMAVTEDNMIVLSLPIVRARGVAYGTDKSLDEMIAEAGAVEDEAVLEEEVDFEDLYDELEGAEVAEEPVKKGIKGYAEYVEDPEEAYRDKYTGKVISLDFQDADVVPIFRFLAEIGGYNVVIHPSVAGSVTLKLTDVPWDHAMDIILELTGNGKGVEGNILRIAPVSIFTQIDEEKARSKVTKVRTVELQQVAVPLKYISALDMKRRLDEAKAVRSQEAGGAGTGRGSIRIDERTNTIIISDTPDDIKNIMEVEIPYWDTPEHGTMQVLIEAKIVSVRTDYTHSLGIRWGGSATSDNFSFINDDVSLDFSVNTPVSSAGSGTTAAGGLLSIGYAETVNLNLSLNALETVQKAKSLANPRVITIDKMAASISKGTAIPYATAADGGGTKIETVDATLALNVTPEIQPNGIIKLQVDVSNDSPTIIPGADAPGIDKQQISTQALVKDGETLVLGGIFTTSEEESEVRVPILADIPAIGWLFKTRQMSKLPNELLIFITPRIIK